MNMIKINLVPEFLRKDRAGLLNGVIGGYPQEVVVGILLAVFGALLILHALLGALGLFQAAQRQKLEVRWGALAQDKKALDDVSGEIRALQARLTAFRPVIFSRPISWAQFMKDVSSSIPKGVSLKQVSLDKGILLIKGSALSRRKNEMVLAGQFVESLKQRPIFADHFVDVGVDYSIQRKEAQFLSVANFDLKAKVK